VGRHIATVRAVKKQPQITDLPIQPGPFTHMKWQVRHDHFLMAFLSAIDLIADELHFQSNVSTGMFSAED
jgi:hypothetical protein